MRSRSRCCPGTKTTTGARCWRSAPAPAATRRPFRRRPLPHVQRYAELRGWRFEPLSASDTGARRHQGGDRRDQGARRVRAAQVRGRRAPRAARAGDRGFRAHPHLGRHRRGAARGRGGRRQIDDERPPDRRLPLERPRRAVGQHDRLRGADHPSADRPRGHLPGREVAAQEQGQGAAGPARPPARARARGARGRARRQPRARSAPATAPSASAPTTSRRAAAPTTASI